LGLNKSKNTTELNELVSTDPVFGLLEIMRQLREPDSGCPWDLQQTMQTIIPHTIEETYEVAHAIMHEQPENICDELGDLLFQVVFYAQLGQEQGWFVFSDIARTVCQKLIRRHPHVFDETCTLTPDEVEQQWQSIKADEKKAQTSNSVLNNIPVGMTPLLRAQKIQKACAKVGFDWPDIAPVFAKVQEEISEVAEALKEAEVSKDNSHVHEEIGDLLFAVVNLARHAGVNSEQALLDANAKFARRFEQVEQAVTDQDQTLSDQSLATLEGLWVSVKANENR